MSDQYTPDQGGYQNQYYRPELRTKPVPPAPIPQRPVSYRRPGVDAGTFLWPLLFAFLHVLIATVVQVPVLFFRIFAEAGSSGLPIDSFFDMLDMATMESYIMQDFVLSACIYSVIQILVYALFLRSRQKKERYYVLTDKPSAFGLLSTFILTLGSLGIAMAWMFLLNFLGSHFEGAADLLKNYEQHSAAFENPNLLLSILGLSILVPIAEELLFRGILLGELRRLMKPWPAIFLSAFLFALFHMNLVQSIYVFAAGLALGFVYLCTESLFAPIMMHILYNFGGSILQQLLADHKLALDIVNYGYMAMSLVSIIFAVMLYKRRKRPSHRPEPVIPDFPGTPAAGGFYPGGNMPPHL